MPPLHLHPWPRLCIMLQHMQKIVVWEWSWSEVIRKVVRLISQLLKLYSLMCAKVAHTYDFPLMFENYIPTGDFSTVKNNSDI